MSRPNELNDIAGVDHAVIAVRDLDAAARSWSRLGFTLSPRGAHSAKMGTGNHTIMLGEDYLELFGILAATEQNGATREFLRDREGVERIAFTSRDAATGADALRARGLAATGPVDFARPVTTDDGSQTEARFATYQWPVDAAPAGVRLFACQHFTRDAVWMPSLQQHANTAHRIVAIEIVSDDAAGDAAELAKLLDSAVGKEGERHVVASGNGRADFVFQSRNEFAARYPSLEETSLPKCGAAGLMLGVRDLDATDRAVGDLGKRIGDAVNVAPEHATGTALVFVAA